MKNLIPSTVLAIAVLAFVMPDAAQAQAQPPRPLFAIPTAQQGQPPKPAPATQTKSSTVNKERMPTVEVRWTSMLNSMAVLAQEGSETRRITPPEKTQIESTITKVRQQINAAKADGISEVEEDAIDTAIMTEMMTIAKAMSDDGRKRAARTLDPAKK